MTGDSPGDPPIGRPRSAGVCRDPARGKLFGVCAGLADHFGVAPDLVRVVAVLLAIPMSIPVIAAYLLLAATLPRCDADERAGGLGAVGAATPALDQRIAALERRLIAIERHVTTREFLLDQRFRTLER